MIGGRRAKLLLAASLVTAGFTSCSAALEYGELLVHTVGLSTERDLARAKLDAWGLGFADGSFCELDDDRGECYGLRFDGFVAKEGIGGLIGRP